MNGYEVVGYGFRVPFYCGHISAWLLIALASLSSSAEEKSAPKQEAFAESLNTIFTSLKDPKVVAYRIDGEGQVRGQYKEKKEVWRIRGWPILAELPAGAEKVLPIVRNFLRSKDHLGQQWTSCFEPGFALHLDDGERTLDLLVCLKCHYLEFHSGDRRERWPLTDKGVQGWKDLYMSLFPTEHK